MRDARWMNVNVSNCGGALKWSNFTERRWQIEMLIDVKICTVQENSGTLSR